MKRIAKTLTLAVLVGVALQGCKTTTAEDVGPEATPFTASELWAYLAGNTVVWDRGGAYYAASGALETLWDGRTQSGTWSVTGNQLCWHVAAWGEQPCEAYYHTADGVRFIYEGEIQPADKIHEGNILDDL